MDHAFDRAPAVGNAAAPLAQVPGEDARARVFDPLAPVTQDPGLNWPTTQADSSRPEIQPRPRESHATAVRAAPQPTSAARLHRRLPPPPPMRPDPPALTAPVTVQPQLAAGGSTPRTASTAPAPISAATAASLAPLPRPPLARPDPAPVISAVPAVSGAVATAAAIASPPAAIAADPVATVVAPAASPAVAPAASGLAHGLPPQPSGRLPLPPGLVDALTAPLRLPSGFAPAPAAATPRASPAGFAAPGPVTPARALADLVPWRPIGQVRMDQAGATPAGMAVRHVNATPARRLSDSPADWLMAHLMPAAPSPFALPRPMGEAVELTAQHPWPFGSLLQRLEGGDSNLGLTAVVVTALIAMTTLTAAGAAVNGRRLKHTAWRSARSRYRRRLPWDVADAGADSGPRRLPAPELQVAPWPRKLGLDPAERPAVAARQRRVA